MKPSLDSHRVHSGGYVFIREIIFFRAHILQRLYDGI